MMIRTIITLLTTYSMSYLLIITYHIKLGNILHVTNTLPFYDIHVMLTAMGGQIFRVIIFVPKRVPWRGMKLVKDKNCIFTLLIILFMISFGICCNTNLSYSHTIFSDIAGSSDTLLYNEPPVVNDDICTADLLGSSPYLNYQQYQHVYNHSISKKTVFSMISLFCLVYLWQLLVTAHHFIFTCLLTLSKGHAKIIHYIHNIDGKK